MPSIVRNLTHVLDNHVEDDRILIFNIDGEDSDGVPTAPTAPIAFPTCAGEGTIQDEAGAFHEGVSVERSRNPDGRREQEAKRDEDRPPTMGERQEPSIIVGSQTSASVEDSAQGSDNCVTLVDDGNQPERDAEHRRLSIVDVSYEVGLSKLCAVVIKTMLMRRFSYLHRTCQRRNSASATILSTRSPILP
jgi:hypothetical protein